MKLTPFEHAAYVFTWSDVGPWHKVLSAQLSPGYSLRAICASGTTGSHLAVLKKDLEEGHNVVGYVASP